MKKRILSMIMAFVMVVGLLPDTAFAAGETDADTQEIRYSIDGGTTWEEDSLLDIFFLTEVRHAKNVQIELLQDITLTADNWATNQQVLGSEDSGWLIDGKGHTITRGSEEMMMFQVNCKSSTVTLKNITIDGGARWEDGNIADRTNSGISCNNNNHLLWVSDGAELILDDGVILKNNYLVNPNLAFGAAVMVGSGSNAPGTLIIKDGVVIKDNFAQSSGTVYVDSGSVFNMEGGEIYNNYAGSAGGAVSNYGIFNMSGGGIHDNASGDNAGAVTDNYSFTMSGGKIYNNTSPAGGGVTAFDGNTVLEGGSITGNKITSSMGGGILVYNGTLSISGNPVVTGNIGKNNTGNNVYLNPGKTITITDALGDMAEIGITTANKPADGNFVDITGENQNDYSTHFKSDMEKFCVIKVIKAGNNVVQLAIPTEYNIVYNTNGGNIEDDGIAEKYMSGTGCTLPGNVIKEGYIFAGWYDNEDCTGGLITEIPATDTGDKQFYAKWSLDAKKGIHYNTNGNDGWQNKDFVVTAGEGYEVSSSPDGGWAEKLSATDETADGTMDFYVREKDTGVISQQISIGYKIDKTYPVINGIEDGKIYEGDTTFSVSDMNLDIVTVDGSEVTLTGSNYTIRADNKEHIIAANDKAGNITTVTVNVKITHNYGTEWSCDDENHWYECTDTDCPDREGSKKDIAAHTPGEWIIDKEATKEEEGSKHKECIVCKKLLETESIPKDTSWSLDAKKGIHYDTNGNDGWQNKDFVVTAAKGYEVSLSPDGKWMEKLSATDETADGTMVFYVKEKNTGIISQQISIGYKIDKTSPVITGIEDGKIYNGDTIFSVSDKNLDIVTVDGDKAVLNEGNYTITADNKEHIIVAADKAGNITTVTVNVKITHNYGTEWSGDDKNHWHECTDTDCPDREGSKKDIAAHTPGEWIIDKEATKEEEGSKHKECIVCKKLLEKESIPKDISSSDGKVTVTAPLIGEDAPDTYIESTKDEIKEAVSLTAEEEAAVKEGSEIKIYLKIEKKAVTQEEKQSIDNARKDYTVGEYIDVSMFKQIDDKEASPVRQLNKKIVISLVVPENLRNKNSSITRTYAVIHNHSGESSAEILEGTYDEKSFTFTFETDRFSTYAIAYKDTVKQTDKFSHLISMHYVYTASPSPSVTPTPVPTATPSLVPMATPSLVPTVTPSLMPTVTPTVQQSQTPAASTVPTQRPVPDDIKPVPSDKTTNANNVLALNAEFKVTQAGNKIKVLWGKVPEADGYDVYVQYCGRKFAASPSCCAESGKVTKVNITKINGRKINLKKSYKLYVVAYKLINNKKVILGKSIIAHNAGIKNKKYTNAKDIKIKKTSYNLKTGKTAKINASTVLADKKKKLLSGNHAKEFRYATSNKNVATVSLSGKIKATGKGSCIVYVYAKNGNAKKIKVKVK